MGHLRYTEASDDEGLSLEISMAIIIGCTIQFLITVVVTVMCCIYRKKAETRRTPANDEQGNLIHMAPMYGLFQRPTSSY